MRLKNTNKSKQAVKLKMHTITSTITKKKPPMSITPFVIGFIPPFIQAV